MLRRAIEIFWAVWAAEDNSVSAPSSRVNSCSISSFSTSLRWLLCGLVIFSWLKRARATSNTPTSQPTQSHSNAQKYLINTIDLDTLTNAQGFSVTGNGASGYANCGGDINGDGKADIVVSVPSNNVCIVYGGTSLSDINFTAFSSNQGVCFTGDSGTSAGYALSCADVNGDNKTDIVIGAPGYHSNTGQVHVVFGSANLPSTIALSSLGSYGVTFFGNETNDYVGWSVSHADVNGDHYQDILIGAPQCYGDGVVAGKAYVIFGNQTLLLNQYQQKSHCHKG